MVVNRIAVSSAWRSAFQQGKGMLLFFRGCQVHSLPALADDPALQPWL